MNKRNNEKSSSAAFFVCMFLFCLFLLSCLSESAFSVKQQKELPLGEEGITEKDISLRVIEYKFTDGYYTNMYSVAFPKDSKLLWIKFAAANRGKLKEKIPGYSDVILRYEGDEKNPDWSMYRNNVFFDGERREEIKWYEGGELVSPNVSREGWVYYTVHKDFDTKEAKISVWGMIWRLE